MNINPDQVSGRGKELVGCKLGDGVTLKTRSGEKDLVHIGGPRCFTRTSTEGWIPRAGLEASERRHFPVALTFFSPFIPWLCLLAALYQPHMGIHSRRAKRKMPQAWGPNPASHQLCILRQVLYALWPQSLEL